MQRATGSLDMVFQHLRAFVALILKFHGFRPDSSCDATDYAVFRINAIAEKEREIGGEFVDVHASAQVILYVRKPVRQGECKLRNRVGTCLRNMIARNRNRIKIPDTLIDKILLYVAHKLQRKLGRKNTGI